jgi:Fur family ferric uptake transcriptional regulator
VGARGDQHPTAPVEPADWQSRLRAKGYRLTPQRGLVLEAVQSLGHATPEEVFAEVHERAPGVNISTVYRTLELLEDLGLVTHTHLGHGPPTFHSATVPEHVHLVCRGCRAVTEVPPAAVDSLVRRLADDLGFSTDVNHLTVFGTCAECTATSSR